MKLDKEPKSTSRTCATFHFLFARRAPAEIKKEPRAMLRGVSFSLSLSWAAIYRHTASRNAVFLGINGGLTRLKKINESDGRNIATPAGAHTPCGVYTTIWRHLGCIRALSLSLFLSISLSLAGSLAVVVVVVASTRPQRKREREREARLARVKVERSLPRARLRARYYRSFAR